MATAQRLSYVDFDVAPDEELPGYDASTAPAYDSGLYDEPLVTYHLRQYDRRIQMLVAYGTPASSYRITTNGFRLFSKKPELELLYTSPERRQRNIATITYDNNSGPLPWRPRAHFNYIDADGVGTTHNMEAVNFADWAVCLQGRTYTWAVDMRPVSLVMCEKDSSFIIARFTYSAFGTAAARGAEVGELTIYRDILTGEREGIDKLVCGLVVSLTHLKRMGRQYTNGLNGLEMSRAGSLSREHSSSHRASSAGFSIV